MLWFPSLLNSLIISFTVSAQSVDKVTLSLPLRQFKINSGFGYRIHPVTGIKKSFHTGIDLWARSDTIFSILPGKVIKVSADLIIGNYIVISHGAFTSIYGHLSKSFVDNGDFVNSGSSIAISGNTGRVTGEHLHFGLKYKGSFLNPLKFLYLFNDLTSSELLLFLTDPAQVEKLDKPAIQINPIN